jgi:hypothetical protein
MDLNTLATKAQSALTFKDGAMGFLIAVVVVLVVLLFVCYAANTVQKSLRYMLNLLLSPVTWAIHKVTGKKISLFEDLEGFADTSATAIMCKQVMEGRPSLCDNVDKAEAAVAAQLKKSTLTGTRDFPVFFQDYNTEMVRKGATIKNEREGYYDPEEFEEPEVYQDGEEFEEPEVYQDGEEFEDPEYYQDGEEFEDPEYYEDGYEAFDELPSENAVDNVKSSDLLNALAGR